MQTVLFQIFHHHFKKIHHVLQTVIGLHWVARQCHQFYAPEHKSKINKQESNQQLIQTVPPTDEWIPGLQTRSILELMEPSLLLAPSTPQTPALQQDRAMEELASETVSKTSMPTEDRSTDTETPVQQVPPLLGTTQRENLQLRTRNSPDGIVVNQPKRFLPLAEEAKCLAEEIHIEKLNE